MYHLTNSADHYPTIPSGSQPFQAVTPKNRGPHPKIIIELGTIGDVTLLTDPQVENHCPILLTILQH